MVKDKGLLKKELYQDQAILIEKIDKEIDVYTKNILKEELDRIDRSENEEDFSEYIVSTNAPERSEKISRSLDEYEDIVRNERIYEKNFGEEKEEDSPIVTEHQMVITKRYLSLH